MTIQTLDDVLAHHGIKGMHWGVRRSSRELAEASSIAKAGPKGTSHVVDKNGKIRAVAVNPRDKVHDDAAAAAIGKAHARASSTDVLSNKELQDVIARMNLEMQYSRLTGSHQESKGKKFVKGFAKDASDVVRGSTKEVAKQRLTKKIGLEFDKRSKGKKDNDADSNGR